MIRIPKDENAIFFFILFDVLALIALDKKYLIISKKRINLITKHVHLITKHGLYDQKSF